MTTLIVILVIICACYAGQFCGELLGLWWLGVKSKRRARGNNGGTNQ